MVSTILLVLVISTSSPVSAFLPDYDRSMYQNGPNLRSFLMGSSYQLEQPQLGNNFVSIKLILNVRKVSKVTFDILTLGESRGESGKKNRWKND